MRIYYDSYQEGKWFESLHPSFSGAELRPFPGSTINPTAPLQTVLSYDRPDIVLTDTSDIPLLVVERTIEVPSGHNVGQRFARLVQAARCGVPCVYFGPYAAFKHGGETSGPRYMNLRLFKALDSVMEVERSPVTTIRWPVDHGYEIVFSPEKDERMRNYLDLYMSLLGAHGNLEGVRTGILSSTFEQEQETEREIFIKQEVRRPEQYDEPPRTVRIGPIAAHSELRGSILPGFSEAVVYEVGMKNIRSDPYTGMAILYAYLYCGGMEGRTRALVLDFPNISQAKWYEVAQRPRKDIRLFREVADAIHFSDGLVLSSGL